jgi:sporulation protein YlmC with PRC-barrel domain
MEGIVMLYSASDLQGYTIHAADGDIGTLRTLYFDEEEWGVENVVVDTGTWITGKHVLVSPDVLGQPDPHRKHLPVSLTREEIKDCPEINTHETAPGPYTGVTYTRSRRPIFWSSDPFVLDSLAARPGGAPHPSPPPATPPPVTEQVRAPVLHSSRNIIGYNIQARDGGMGHVEDFIIDTDTWHIRYMVVDTKNWWPGKKVLVSPQWIQAIRWGDAHVTVDLSRDQIKTSPEYDPSQPIPRDYESRLHGHYGRPVYWQ